MWLEWIPIFRLFRPVFPDIDVVWKLFFVYLMITLLASSVRIWIFLGYVRHHFHVSSTRQYANKDPEFGCIGWSSYRAFGIQVSLRASLPSDYVPFLWAACFFYCLIKLHSGKTWTYRKVVPPYSDVRLHNLLMSLFHGFHSAAGK